MFNLLLLASLAGVAVDIDLTALKPRDVVQLVLQDDSSVLGGVVAATADAVEVMNLETQTARTFSPRDLKAIRSGLSVGRIVDRAGAGPYAAWQLAPIFENASRVCRTCSQSCQSSETPAARGQLDNFRRPLANNLRGINGKKSVRLMLSRSVERTSRTDTFSFPDRENCEGTCCGTIAASHRQTEAVRHSDCSPHSDREADQGLNCTMPLIVLPPNCVLAWFWKYGNVTERNGI